MSWPSQRLRSSDDGNFVRSRVSSAAPTPGRRRLISDAVWLFSGRVGNSLLLLLATALIARLLSAPDFGAYLLAFNTALTLAFLFGLGIDQASVRYIAEYLAKSSIERASGLCRLAAFILIGWLPLAWLLTSFLLLPLLGGLWSGLATLAGTAPLVATWGALLGLRLVVVGMLRGAQEIPLAAVTDGIGAQAMVCAGLGLVVAVGTAWGVAVTIELQITANAVFVGLGLTGVWLHLARYRPLQGVSGSKLITTSLPLMTTGLSTVLGNQLILMMIGGLGSTSEVALFGLAVQIANAIYLLFIVVHFLAGPIVATARISGDQNSLALAAKSLASFVSVPTLILGAVIAGSAHHVLPFAFGDFYKPAAILVIVFVIGRLIEVMLGLSHTILMMGGKERSQATLRLTGSILTPLLAWPAYKGGGLIAIATVLAASWIVQSATAAWLVHRHFGFWPVPTLRPSFSSVLPYRRSRIAYHK